MSENEKLLITLMKHLRDANSKAIMLQSLIQEFGPLSEEAGKAVREGLGRQ